MEVPFFLMPLFVFVALGFLWCLIFLIMARGDLKQANRENEDLCDQAKKVDRNLVQAKSENAELRSQMRHLQSSNLELKAKISALECTNAVYHTILRNFGRVIKDEGISS